MFPGAVHVLSHFINFPKHSHPIPGEAVLFRGTKDDATSLRWNPKDVMKLVGQQKSVAFVGDGLEVVG